MDIQLVNDLIECKDDILLRVVRKQPPIAALARYFLGWSHKIIRILPTPCRSVEPARIVLG
jgi:hypothetical protein